MSSLQPTSVTTFEIPSPLRTQLLISISTTRLTEIISLAKDATIEDPSIDFLTAVKALARCSKPDMAKTPPDDEDVEMTDWTEEMDVDVPSSRSTGSVARVARPRVEVLVARAGGARQYGRIRSGQQEDTKGDENEDNWQRRERMALKRAYAVAFTWWPHAKTSQEQCESFLQKHSV